MPNSRRIYDPVIATIDALRFPLIVGVVFIHGVLPNVSYSLGGEYPIYSICSKFFSGVVAEICVPLFFLFSGFMFFYSVDTFSTSVYLAKLRRRFISLFIPYLFWNILAFVFLYLFSDRLAINHRYDFTSISSISLLWSVPISGRVVPPIAWQFWFIRDLIVCCLMSPLIYMLVTRTRHLGVILLGLAWFVGYEIPVIGPYGFSMAAIFFFTLGAWCSRYRRNLFSSVCPFRFCSFLWLCFVILSFVSFSPTVKILVNRCLIISGIILLFWLCKFLMSGNRLKSVPFLTSSVFFVFAFHVQYAESPLRKLLFMFFSPESDLAITVVYFSHIVLSLVLSLGVYYLLSRFTPSFCRIITGSRSIS